MCGGSMFQRNSSKKDRKTLVLMDYLLWMKVLVVQLIATPWAVAHQASLSMEFSRKEHWSGLSFPSPGDLSHPGIEPMSPALHADFFLLSEPPMDGWSGTIHKLNKNRYKRRRLQLQEKK